MKYRDTGFRSFYRAFIAVPVTEELRKIIRQFPGADEAGFVLTYGYIDPVAGMTRWKYWLRPLKQATGFGFGIQIWKLLLKSVSVPSRMQNAITWTMTKGNCTAGTKKKSMPWLNIMRITTWNSLAV
jgi:hypothetical protein